MVMHILLTPTPKLVENVFAVELNSNHHTIGHAFSTNVSILHIGDIGHVVAHFEITLVRTSEDVIEDLL